jgi:diacylglycerol kinase (ATP)
MAPHVQIATNPDAGNYSAKVIKNLRKAFEDQGATTSLIFVGPDKQLLIEDDTAFLCVAGGDGTIRHAAATILESGRDVRLVPYPLGTVNLFQRDTGSPKEMTEFARLALSGSASEIHYPANANGSTFLGCASVGPDAHAVAGVSTRLKSVIGRGAYGVAMLKLLLRWPRPRLTITAEGKRHAVEAVYIANGAHFAGPWSFAPNADRRQPKLHVVALKQAGRRKFWRFIRNTMRGRPLDDRDNLVCFACASLHIEGDDAWPIQLDGDDGGFLPVSVTIENQTIKVG